MQITDHSMRCYNAASNIYLWFTVNPPFITITFQVVWRRIDPNADPAEREQPLAIGKFVFSEDVRIRVEITRDDDITTSSLIIEKLEPTDAGQYACEINTRNPKFTGDLTRYIQLNVKGMGIFFI